jgi:subtilisin family serine protease
MKSIGLVLAAVVIALSSAANAGEILRMKAGDVDLRVQANRMGAVIGDSDHVWVVQYQNRITREDRLNLTTLGAQVLRYLPDDALVIRANAKLARTIEGSSSAIRAVALFDDSWKVSSNLGPANVFSAGNRSVVHVRLFPFKSAKLETRAVARIRAIPGVEVKSADGRSLVLAATRAQIAEIAHNDDVEWIQPNPKFETMNFRTLDDATADQPANEPNGDYTDLSGYESGTKVMNFDGAWSKGLTGKGQIVAMADTGLDSGDANAIHPDFTGRITTGIIFGFFSKSWGDPMGHGTHVAGSVLSSGVQSKGALKGGAYDANMVAESMWSPMLNGLAVPPKLSDLYSKAYDAGARVHTNSWGKAADFGAYDSFAQMTDEFMASHPDMLIVFAAGNSGVDDNKDGRIDDNSIGSPGTAKNVLTVGASKNLVAKGGIQKPMKELRDGTLHWGVEPIASSRLSENAGGLAAFSSRGPTQDGRMKPEIVAPGTNILSTRSHDPKAELLWGAYNKDYVWSGGTSMATPLTSGAVTIIRQYLIEMRGFATPSAALMKATIIHSATDLFPGQFGEIGKDKGQELLSRRPNTDEGYGLVNVARATDLGNAVMVDERAGVGSGETLAYPVKVSGKAHLTATLVWTDAASAAGAAKALVNDLDLVLVNTANGNETTINDHVNNTELIEADVAPGSYEVRVKGSNVPQGPAAGKQPFAVVVSVQ